MWGLPHIEVTYNLSFKEKETYNLSFKEMLTKEQPEASAAFYLNGSCSKLLECLNCSEKWTEAPSTIVTILFCHKNVLNWCFCFQNQVIPLCIPYKG